MSLEIPFGITPTNPVYVEAYRGPYDNVAEALSTVPQVVRVLGQVVFVEGVGEYWWKDSVADAGLIEKTSGSSFPFNLESNITGAQFSLITANYGVDLNVPLFLIRNETSVDLINTKADLIIGAGNLNGDLEAKTRNILGHNNVNLDVAGEDLVVVGSNNIKNSTGDRLIVIGNNNQPIATSGDDVLIGNSIFNSASTSSGFNIALGTSAGAGFESVSFGNNIIGAYAAYLGTGALGGYNNLIGAVAYSVNDIGSNNNLMGYLVAQNAVSIDDHNILIGSFVAQNVNNVTKYNTFIGYKVAQDATGEGIIGSNEWNTGIGALALENADLSSLDLTTAIGASSMKYAGGESNTAVGRASGWEMKGGYNTALGSRSGKSSDSNISTFLDGASNGDGTDYTGQRSTFIGYDSGYEAVAAALNDMLVIGTYLGSEQGATYISAIGNLYLISNTGTSEVKLKFPNVYGQPNQVLTDVLGNGELSWQDTASLNDTAISSNSTWSSDKINSSFQSIGGKRLRKVESIIDATTYPLTVNTGDRYILGTQTPIDSQWGGGIANQIAEYNGTSWDFTTPEEGNNTFVDSEDKDARFVDDGTPTWELESTAINLFNGNGTTYDPINNKYDLGGALTQDTTIDLDSNEFNLVNLSIFQLFSPTGVGISIEEDSKFIYISTGDGNEIYIEGGGQNSVYLSNSSGTSLTLDDFQAILSYQGGSFISVDEDSVIINDSVNNNYITLDEDGIRITDFSNNILNLSTDGIRLVDSINNVQIRTNAGGLLLEGDYTSGLTANNLITKAYLDSQLGNISGDATNLTYVPSTRELQSSTGSNVTLPLVVANGDDGLILGTDKQKLDGIQESAQVNVQSDWNATSGDSFIQNKPTIPSVEVLKSIHLRTTTPANFRTPQSVVWDLEDFKDSDSFTHSTTTSSSEIEVLQDGLVEVDCNIVISYTINSRVVVRAVIRKNGVNVDQKGSQNYYRGTNSDGSAISFSTSVFVVAGDKLEVFVEIVDSDNGTAALNLNTSLCELIIYKKGTTALTNTFRPEITDAEVLTKFLNNSNTEVLTTAAKVNVDKLSSTESPTSVLNGEGNYVEINTLESLTSLTLVNNILSYTDEDGTVSTISLAQYVDTNAAVIQSGVLNATTGIVTFTKDDNSTFTLDLSELLSPEATQAEALALTEPDLRSWSPDLIGQAIDSKLTQIVVTTEQEFYDALALDLGNKDIRVKGVIALNTERGIGVNPVVCRGVNTVQVDPETGGYQSAPSFLFFNANLFFDPSIVGTINIDVFRVDNEVTIEGGVVISTNLIIGNYTNAAQITSSTGVKININTFLYQRYEDVLFDPSGTAIQAQFSNPDQLNYVYVSTLQQLNLALRNSSNTIDVLDIYISKEISENGTLLVSGSENKVIRGESLSILSLNITNGINIDFHNDINIGTIDTQGTIRAKNVLGNTTVNTGNFEYEYASGVVSGIGATQDFWSNTNKLNEASVSAIVSANLGNIPQEINLELDSSQLLSRYSKYFNFGTTFDSTSLFINIDSFPSNSFVSINLRRVRGSLVQNTGNNSLTNPSNAVVTLNSLITTHITQPTDKFQINFSFIGATTRDEVISLSTL